MASAGVLEPLSTTVVRYSKAGFVPVFRDLLGDPHSGECPQLKGHENSPDLASLQAKQQFA